MPLHVSALDFSFFCPVSYFSCNLCHEFTGEYVEFVNKISLPKRQGDASLAAAVL